MFSEVVVVRTVVDEQGAADDECFTHEGDEGFAFTEVVVVDEVVIDASESVVVTSAGGQGGQIEHGPDLSRAVAINPSRSIGFSRLVITGSQTGGRGDLTRASVAAQIAQFSEDRDGHDPAHTGQGNQQLDIPVQRVRAFDGFAQRLLQSLDQFLEGAYVGLEHGPDRFRIGGFGEAVVFGH